MKNSMRCCFVLLLGLIALAQANQYPAVKAWLKVPGLNSRQGVSLHCHLLHLFYIQKPLLQTLIKQKNMHWLSDQGSAQLLAKQHQVIICDDMMHYQKLKTMLQTLNIPPKQIKIRAKIIRIDKNYLRDLGLKFSTESSKDHTSDSAKDGLSIVLSTLKAQDLLMMQLHALVNQGHAEVVANPTVLTHVNVSANIESGEEVPYQQGALSGGTSIAFKKAVMQLSVVPHIIAPNKVSLDIKVHQDKVTPATVNGVPIISTEQLSTTATIKNHNTLLLGGIIEKQTSTQVEGVPILRHLPIVGLLFQRHRKQIDKKELLIMIKPEW